VCERERERERERYMRDVSKNLRTLSVSMTKIACLLVMLTFIRTAQTSIAYKTLQKAKECLL